MLEYDRIDMPEETDINKSNGVMKGYYLQLLLLS